MIKSKKGNVIYVDFIFPSLMKAVSCWYKENIPQDIYGSKRKSHLFILSRMYNRERRYNRFGNHDTIGKERDAFLEEVDLEFQMRRWD